jgi:hypothetical protein
MVYKNFLGYFFGIGAVMLGTLQGSGADFRRLMKPTKPRTIIELSDSLVSMAKQLVQSQVELEKLNNPSQDLQQRRNSARLAYLQKLAQDARDLMVQVKQRASKVDYVSYPTLQPRLDELVKTLNAYHTVLFNALVLQATQKAQAGIKETEDSRSKIGVTGSVGQAPDDTTYEKMIGPFTRGSIIYDELIKTVADLQQQRADYIKMNPDFAGKLDMLQDQIKNMQGLLEDTVKRIRPYQEAINRAVERDLAAERERKYKAFDEQRARKTKK